jgi:hypothetical protein
MRGDAGRGRRLPEHARLVVMGTGAVVCAHFAGDVESLVTGAGGNVPVRAGRARAARRSRWCGALLGDRVAAVHDQVLPGDVGRAGAGQPGNRGGDLAG